jgi:hypothetical protein
MIFAYSTLKTIYPSALYKFTFKIKNVRKVKILFLAAFVIGAVSMFSCSKSNNSTSTKDSVYYSPWQTVSMEPTDAGDTAYTGTISASKITASILNSGAVLTYLGDAGFPGTGDTAAESAVDFGLYSTLVPGSIEIQSFGYLNDFSGTLFRYVVIPGTVLETTGLTRQQLKSMSFTEVTNTLHSASTKTSSPSLTTP